MGRKIPGKKHKGVKDPEKQREKRESELRKKVDSAPKVIDDQEMPKRLVLLAKAREEAKQKPKKNPKVPKSDNDDLLDSSKYMGVEMKLPGMKKDLKPIPVFKQHPGERPRQFFRRMNQQVTQFLKQKQYEAKFNVDLVQDPESGKTKFVDREKDELDEHAHNLRAKKLAKRGIVLKTKEEKRALRRQKEKEKKLKKKRRAFKQTQMQSEDFNDLNDNIKFNDVVQEPPKLTALSKNNEARRPGQQKDLLLLSDKKNSGKVTKVNSRKKTEKDSKSGKKQKMKMSMAKKQIWEAERISIVEQYRAIKEKSHKF